MEKKITGQVLYAGKILSLCRDEVLLDDNSKVVREIVKHRGGVAIALKNQNNKYYLVKQYRYALGTEMYEFCAGKLEKGEDPKDAIIREAREELGYSLKNLRAFGYIVPTCGYSTEKIYLYYAEADQYLGQKLDVDERIEVLELPFAKIGKMIEDGTIVDAKTVCLYARIVAAGIDG